MAQRQRSSQEILEFADYMNIHHTDSMTPIRAYQSEKSFSTCIPTLVEFEDPKLVFEYFEDKFSHDEDVLVLHEFPTNFLEIEKSCEKKGWKSVYYQDVRGFEASIIIIYDLRDKFGYEWFTRAKHQLYIVTITGRLTQRYNFELSYPIDF